MARGKLRITEKDGVISRFVKLCLIGYANWRYTPPAVRGSAVKAMLSTVKHCWHMNDD